MEENWTILKVLKWTAGYFSEKGLDQPRSDAEVLLAHVLGLDRIQLYLRFDQPLGGRELARFREAVKRRAGREPVQYITGKKEFWSLEMEVSPSVLIPRPETELLVERALELVGNSPAHVLDIGTGSGAIAVALAHEKPALRVFAIDSSTEALKIAARNAARHGVEKNILFASMDLLSAFRPGRASFNLIVSNPPYVGESELADLAPEVAKYEPEAALRGGGEDGLGVIRRVLGEYPPYLASGGALLMEIGYGQAEALRAELNADPRIEFEYNRDYAGIMRVLEIHGAGARRCASVCKQATDSRVID